jgi:hypothetical protein
MQPTPKVLVGAQRSGYKDVRFIVKVALIPTCGLLMAVSGSIRLNSLTTSLIERWMRDAKVSLSLVVSRSSKLLLSLLLRGIPDVSVCL